MTGGPDEESGYLTVNQAAEMAGMSPRTIRRWIAQGRIPARRLGGRLAILREDFERLILRPEEEPGG